MIFFCLGAIFLVSVAGGGATSITSGSSLVSTGQKPDFLSHVDHEAIEKALSVAKMRHQNAVTNALQCYDTDSVPREIDEKALSEVQFKKYEIHAPGSIPDFVDELPRAVYVTDPPLFSKAECDQVIRDVEDFVGEKPWGTLPSGQYAISGVWVKDVPAVREWFNKAVRQRLFPLLMRLYPNFVDDLADLCVDSAYLFKYTPETGRRTDVHTDCGCLSFTIALNSNTEYEGGGTWFEGLQKDGSPIVEMDAGQVTLRPGGVKHAGCATEGGARYIIGGFLLNRKRVENVRMLLLKDQVTSEETQKSLAEAAVVLSPGCDMGYNFLANHYEETGDPGKAQQVLEYGLQHAHPGSSELAYALGSIYLKQKDHKKTLECMEICLKMDSCDIDALTIMANVYNALGERDRELDCYERVVTAPAASDKRIADAFCNLGVISEGTDAEVAYYLKSLEYAPQEFAPRFSLGAAYLSRKLWKEAVDTLRTAVGVAENEEDESSALHSLYQAATRQLQSERPSQNTREAQLTRLQEIMGLDNFNKIASTARK